MASTVPRRDQVRADLLAATERLLAGGESFGSLNVERIAREAGISRTAFYFSFRDKRELLMALTEDVNQILYAEAEGWFTGETPLREALERIVALYAEHAPLFRAVVETAAADETVAAFWRALLGRFVDATSERLGDPETAFLLVWMTERACYQRIVQGGDPLAPAFTDALIATWERAAASAAGS